jgi:hypothetical protein
MVERPWREREYFTEKDPRVPSRGWWCSTSWWRGEYMLCTLSNYTFQMCVLCCVCVKHLKIRKHHFRLD